MKKHLLGFAAVGVALAAVAVNASGVLAASSGDEYPAPSDVVATLAPSGVQLEWQVKFTGVNDKPYTETFDKYGNGDTYLYPWKTVNANGASHYGDQGTDAFEVMPTGGEDGGVGLRTSYVSTGLNDWLISPELSGVPQTITFCAKAYNDSYSENIKVWYSTTDRQTASFTEIMDIEVANTSWDTFSFDVPADAKYFAINVVSVDKYYCYLDNITFIPKVDPSNLVRETFTQVDDTDVVVDNSYHGFTYINANNCLKQNSNTVVNYLGLNSSDRGKCLTLYYSKVPEEGGQQWLISPELLVGGQEISVSMLISHVANNNLKIYAASEPTIEAFQATTPVLTLTQADVTTTTEFLNFTFEIPTDARYFAIYVDEYDGADYYIDDVYFRLANAIGYAPAKAPAKAVTYADIEGYNVYCNNVKVNDELVTVLNYYDTSVNGTGDLSYVIEAVYHDGTTTQSEPCVITVDAADITYPAPSHLNGSLSGEGVALSWTAADLFNPNDVPVTEDFSSYDTGKVTDTLGPWKVVNNNNASHKNAQESAPYMVINEDANKSLISYWIDSETPNDDWLISPMLNHYGQTITFRTKSGGSSESFNVLYSTTGDNVEDFVCINETPYTVGTSWTEFTVDIPAGAYYFAIQCVSLYKDGFYVDDITYVPRVIDSGAARKIFSHFLGYNVYRDGVKLNSTPLDVTNFLDPDPETGKVNVYTVKALYEAGESEASNAVSIEVKADPVPTRVKAAITSEGINVSWTAVDLSYDNLASVTEDFESFPTTVPDGECGPWTVINNNGNNHADSSQGKNPWFTVNNDDGHGKVLSSSYCSNSEANDDWLISPRLNRYGQTISFYARSENNSTLESLKVYISANGNTVKDFTANAPALSVGAVPYAWTRYEVEIPADVFYFAIVYTSENRYYLYLDDITYIPAQAPASAPARKLRDLRGYNVYCNGELINDEPVEGTSLFHSSLAGAGTYSYTVTAVYASGETEASDASVVTIEDTDIELPAVEEVNGTVSDANVTLTWTAPAPPVTDDDVVEDFTSYEASDLVYEGAAAGDPVYGTLGDWTLVNGTGVDHGNMTNNTNPWALYTYGGKKCLADGYHNPRVDDWIISPLLTGIAQTLSFSARSINSGYPDTFEVLASSTDNALTSFTLLEKVTEVSAAEWVTITVELPAGTKYFAIRNVSADCYGLAISDISFKAPTKVLCGTLIGYNVYRQVQGGAAVQARAEAEWVKVNDTPVTETSFTDAPGAGSYVYKVAAVYPFGESELAGNYLATVETTGIGAVKAEAADGVAEYFTLQGVRVERPVSGQVYIVRRGTTVTKQLVK